MKLMALVLTAFVVLGAGAASACPFKSDAKTATDTTILPPKTTGS